MIHFQAARTVSGSLDPHVPERLKKAARAVLEVSGAGSAGDMSIVLTTDREIQSLNREYRGVDAATDVLSFPAAETDPRSGTQYLGDVIISVERARLNVETSQSEYEMSSLEDELVLLTVHGTLHLFGHDHAEADEKARMWAAQENVLRSLGLTV